MIDPQTKASVTPVLLSVVRKLQLSPGSWVDFARVGKPLADAGVSYKAYGYLKLRPFLNEFENVLSFQEVLEDGKTPVCFVRPRSDDASGLPDSGPVRPEPEPRVKVPMPDQRLYDWAFIYRVKVEALADLCLPEKWYYGTAPEPGRELAILYNYLDYTFRRLSFEKKVRFAEDTARGEEYAAFNTGLVDRKYEYIYALFTRNTRPGARQYWFLLDFVVAGEDGGKTLVSLFNPLPQRADYFENKIENMLYDASTGDLSCDYIHMLTERCFRLPLEFLEDNCPADMLCIDGVTLQEIYHRPMDEEKKAYFRELGSRIKNTPRILNRLKNRLADAVELALKRVAWNYKTAIPTYYPKNNSGSLLLPLALADEDHVDLALVVERQPSGSYQGQTILPLDIAYSNSRLVARPDSDWLQTDTIAVDPSDRDLEES